MIRILNFICKYFNSILGVVNMKILVFRATGPTGQHIVRQGLELGYENTAFVRDPSRLNIKHPHLSVLTSDAQKFNSVLNAVRGYDII
jgi:putative NADH-flavin reductase